MVENKDPKDLSVQKRTEENAKIASGFTFWFSSNFENEFDIPAYWSEWRDIELDAFVKKPGNDILQGGLASLVKKFKAMSWILEGPEKPVRFYHDVLSNAEFGKGWGNLLGKTLERYWTQDKGGLWELIGDGDPNGPIEGPVLAVAYLDNRYCQPTGDSDYPIIYHNSKTNKAHALHKSRVIRFIDMPSPIEEMNDIGFCAVSRLISSSAILLKLNKYKNEKLSDLPEAGMLIFSNINKTQFEDIRAEFETDRQRMGQEYWRSIMTLFGLDPSQPADAKFIDFSKLPDAFNEFETIQTYINILALAFGVDAREFWPVSSGTWGNVMETSIQHLKAKGKAIGELISTIEREINWHILPKSVRFKFKFKDDEEDLSRADINRLKIESIMSMYVMPSDGQLDRGVLPPISRTEIRQMLADNVEYFKEDFLEVDLTEDIHLTDTEKSFYLGKNIQMDKLGRVKTVRKDLDNLKRADNLLNVVEENYKNGLIELDDILDFRLGEIMDKKLNG